MEAQLARAGPPAGAPRARAASSSPSIRRSPPPPAPTAAASSLPASASTTAPTSSATAPSRAAIPPPGPRPRSPPITTTRPTASSWRPTRAAICVVQTFKSIDAGVPVKKVHASRGKYIRAEPVSALYDEGRVAHVGEFPELERQMCDFAADGLAHGKSPDRLDALVWAITELMLAPTRATPCARVDCRGTTAAGLTLRRCSSGAIGEAHCTDATSKAPTHAALCGLLHPRLRSASPSLSTGSPGSARTARPPPRLLTGPLLRLRPPRPPAWCPRDYAAFAREGFMQNAVLYRAVRMIAEAAASVPLLLYRGRARKSPTTPCSTSSPGPIPPPAPPTSSKPGTASCSSPATPISRRSPSAAPSASCTRCAPTA